VVTLSGQNSYTGYTEVAAGTLCVGSKSALGAPTAPVYLDGPCSSGGQSVSLLIDGGYTVSQNIEVDSYQSGTVTLGSDADATSTYSGQVSLHKDLTLQQVATTGGHALNVTGEIYAAAGSDTLTFSALGDIQASGVVADGGGSVSLVKSGSGTLTLAGNNTYTGATTVGGGTLLVDGSLGTTAVTVVSGTLGGSGSIAGPVEIEAQGTLAPGDGGTGILTVLGNLTLDQGSYYAAQINGTTAGTGYTQTRVTGSVSIGTSVTLVLSGTLGNPNGQSITLVDNDGSGAVSGAFDGLSEGTSLAFNGYNYQITYLAGPGADVALVPV
jgi:autotransporter-associated beta strand protein